MCIITLMQLYLVISDRIKYLADIIRSFYGYSDWVGGFHAVLCKCCEHISNHHLIILGKSINQWIRKIPNNFLWLNLITTTTTDPVKAVYHFPVWVNEVHWLELHKAGEALVEPEVVPPFHGYEVAKPLKANKFFNRYDAALNMR